METKKCPYCAEVINKDAIKCKHCGEILSQEYFEQIHKKESVPIALIPQNFTWAIVIALTSICLSFIDEFSDDVTTITLLSSASLIYLWFLFRKYLTNFKDEKAIMWINWIIAMEVSFAIIIYLSDIFPAFNSESDEWTKYDSLGLFFFICIIILMIASIYVYIKAGISIQKIKDDFIGLLKELGMSITYLLPITFILFFVGIIIHNTEIKLVAEVIDSISTIIMILIFQRAINFQKLHAVKNEFDNRAQSGKINTEKNSEETTQAINEETVSKSNTTKYGFSILAVVAIIFKIYTHMNHHLSGNEKVESPKSSNETQLQNPSQESSQSKNNDEVTRTQSESNGEQTNSSVISSNRKLRYLFYANGGLRGYFDDGTITACPRCDLLKDNVNDLYSEKPFETYTVEDGFLLIDGEAKEYPDTAQDWAMIDYKWIIPSYLQANDIIPDSL